MIKIAHPAPILTGFIDCASLAEGLMQLACQPEADGQTIDLMCGGTAAHLSMERRFAKRDAGIARFDFGMLVDSIRAKTRSCSGYFAYEFTTDTDN
jgi:hypothetical protein